MDQDKFALVEKILKDVDHVLSKNPELCTFDIVPVDSNFHNKSPVLHLENCLGIESWCVKHVYMYCYTEIMDNFFSKSRKKLRISAFNSERIINLFNVTLLLNPELSTLWNKRRELVLRSFLDREFELKFTKLVLSRKHKCNEAFAYRRWLLDLVFQDNTLQLHSIDDIVNSELNICTLSAERSPNNYHSWSHRIWLLRTLKTTKQQLNMKLLYIKEYEFSEHWASKHVSDYSCFHYRQFCIKNIRLYINDDETWNIFENTMNGNLRKNFVRLITDNFPKDATLQATKGDLLSYPEDDLVKFLVGDAYNSCSCFKNQLMFKILEILFYELSLNNELIGFYKNHETLWYHRRFIVREILEIVYSYFGLVRQNGVLVKSVCGKCHPAQLRQKQAKIVRYDSSYVYCSVLFRVLLGHELRFTEERLCEEDNYANRHEKYLKFIEGLDFGV